MRLAKKAAAFPFCLLLAAVHEINQTAPRSLLSQSGSVPLYFAYSQFIWENTGTKNRLQLQVKLKDREVHRNI